VSELELLRDGCLTELATTRLQDPHRCCVAVDRATQIAQDVAVVSVDPSFWWELVPSKISCWDEVGTVSLEDLARLMFSCLHEARIWEHCGGDLRKMNNEDVVEHVATEGCGCGMVVSNCFSATTMEAHQGSQILPPPIESDLQALGRSPVKLHIYDVTREPHIQTINRVMAHESSPVKLGGLFHVGVEVNGEEYCFGYTSKAGVPGVWQHLPRSHPYHHYRQTLYLDSTKLSPKEVGEVVGQMSSEYMGTDYHVFHRNCTHFAHDLCTRLGVGGLPGWVHRLAHVGACVDNAVRAVNTLHGWFRDTFSFFACGPQPTSTPRASVPVWENISAVNPL